MKKKEEEEQQEEENEEEEEDKTTLTQRRFPLHHPPGSPWMYTAGRGRRLLSIQGYTSNGPTHTDHLTNTACSTPSGS